MVEPNRSPSDRIPRQFTCIYSCRQFPADEGSCLHGGERGLTSAKEKGQGLAAQMSLLENRLVLASGTLLIPLSSPSLSLPSSVPPACIEGEQVKKKRTCNVIGVILCAGVCI